MNMWVEKLVLMLYKLQCIFKSKVFVIRLLLFSCCAASDYSFIVKISICFLTLEGYMSVDYFVVPVGESVLWHARSHHNSKLYEETLNKKLPSCEALRKIYGSG